MKKKSLKSLKKKCDKAWSDYIYRRDKGICQWCGKKIKHRRGAHAHHIISRAISNLYGRYAPENGVLLCYYCHFFRLKNEPFEYTKFIESYLAEKDLTYEELREMYQAPAKFTRDTYLYVLENLKGER